MLFSFPFTIQLDFQVRKIPYSDAVLEEMLESKKPFLASLQPALCLVSPFLSCKFVSWLHMRTHTYIYVCTHTQRCIRVVR